MGDIDKIDIIRNAIDVLENIEFEYDGDSRVVEPHLLGYNQTGTLTLSAWQIFGRSGIGWRSFHVAKIISLQSTDQHFNGARPDYNPNDIAMDPIIHRIRQSRTSEY